MSRRRPSGRRGDLARVLDALPDADPAAVARLLGFHHAPPRSPAPARLPVEGAHAGATPGPIRLTGTPQFWKVVATGHREERPRPPQTKAPVVRPAELLGDGDPCFVRDTPPVAPLGRLEPRLRRALAAPAARGDIDIPRAVLRLGQALALDPVPRQPRDAWPARLHLWLHTAPRHVLLEDDQLALWRLLRARLGHGCVELRLGERAATFTGAVPIPGRVVLAVTDFGLGPRERRRWVALGLALRERGVHAVAVVPWSAGAVPRALHEVWTVVPWDGAGSVQDRSAGVEALLTLCAGAWVVRPGLLRALRLLLPESVADGATELEVWAHEAVGSPGRMGFVVGGRLREERVQAFRRLPAATQSQVYRLVRHWSAGLPAFSRHVATLGWHHAYGVADADAADADAEGPSRATPVPACPADLAAARRWVAMLGEGLKEGVPRVHAAVLERMGAALRAGAREAVEQDDAVRAVYERATADRRERPAVGGAPPAGTEVQHWELRQVGPSLELQPALEPRDPAVEPPRRGAPLALVRAGGWVTARGKDQALAPGHRIPLGKPGRLKLDFGFDTVVVEAAEAPPWATATGCDPFGLWADAALGTTTTVTQRFRWIPPGRFWMGSPEGEVGRSASEELHLVTLTRGYWLADTPVTQALWEAVMGEGTSPSRFQSPDRPVEQMSFEDLAGFVSRLHAADPANADIALPSEAEWERACRGGTAGATWRGELDLLGQNHAPRLDDIAWYGGNSGVGFGLDDGVDNSGWPEKQHEDSPAGTHPVTRKDANPLGLYDMLGNVWEWCADAWTGHLGTSPVTDPLAPGDAASGRVFRGGSWDSSARRCRAAYRRGSPPGDRWFNRGFRLARGPAPASRAAELQGRERCERSGGGGAEPADTGDDAARTAARRVERGDTR